MKTKVAIIGAGPAGSTAAIALSKKGIPNILIDKRDTVGIPVQCAEFVGLNINSYIDLNNIPSAVNQKIKFMDIDAGKNIYRFDGKGYVLNRAVFDLHLAGEAVKAGSKLLTSARVYKINRQKNSIEVLNSKEKILYEIYYDYLIAATGPKNGFVSPKNSAYIYAVQIKADLLKKLDSVICYFRAYIPYGYGWVFPKGEFANVGIGIEKPASALPLSLSFDKFLSEIRNAGLIGREIIEKTSGLVPVSGLNEITDRNIALCGDAAGLTHPVTGAGILSAVISGGMAGDYAAESVRTSQNLFEDYKEELESVFKKPLFNAAKKRSELYPLMKDASGIEENIKRLWPSFDEYYK
jgi:geranylgeranyl reductase family protein